jgi:hypothetical protein
MAEVMQALAFLLFAAGCFVAAHALDEWKRRRQLARRNHARPMTSREFRDTYYLGIEKEW